MKKNRKWFLVTMSSFLFSQLSIVKQVFSMPKEPIGKDCLSHISEQVGTLNTVNQAGVLSSPSDCQIGGVRSAPSTEVHNVDELIDYSVNLMWVNKELNSYQEFLYPAKDEQELQKKFLSHVTNWAASTSGGGSVNLWYDGMLTPVSAVKNTREILERQASEHPEWATIHFRDVRDFPEVKDHPDVFSEKTPVYFRVDLLRVLAAYHILSQGEKDYFVYGDLDMKSISKEELFDKKTKDKLDAFGIVMTSGIQGFENGFQIIGKQKPNLLKALKTVLIDVGIARANHILQGGKWQYENPGDTKPLEQTVYGSYREMFHYFYHLEGWGKLSDFEEHGTKIFKLDGFEQPLFEPESKNIMVNKVKFSPSTGKEEKIKDKVKFPTKIVDIPISRFGGVKPKKFDPDKISMKNFHKKLAESLEGKSKFDNNLLYLAAINNYSEETSLIANKLSPAELTEALISENTIYRGNIDCKTPLDAAVSEGHSEIVRIIIEKLSSYPELIAQAAEALIKTYGYDKKTSIHRAVEYKSKKHIEIMQVLAKAFSNHSKVLSLIGETLVGMKEVDEVDLDLLQFIMQKVPDFATEKTTDGETLALKAAKGGHLQLLKIFAKKAPQTLDEKNKAGDFPLLIVAKDADFDTFEFLWKASKKMLTEKNQYNKTLAHASAENGRLDIIKLIAKEAPELLETQDYDESTPVDDASRKCNSLEVFKFLVDHYPETLRIKNRFGWTPAATAANSNNTEGLEYLLEKQPALILSDFSHVLERAAISNPTSLVYLANKFPERLPQIMSQAKRWGRTPKPVIEELEKMEATLHPLHE